MRDRSLFITGASGYVGRNLLGRIDPQTFGQVRSLVRRNPGPQEIAGDLTAPATYRDALAGCDTVIHLASLTGKSAPAECFRVNREGTRLLVEACEQAGVRNFLHVSTIAVKYPDLSGYHYAQAKRDAEEIVRSSRLRYTILRPTMIFGQRAPVLLNLTKLALLPVVPVFGDGRARVQPIHIDDLVRLMLAIVAAERFDNEVLDAGGPESLPIEDLLQRIRIAHGRRPARVIHLPVRMVEPCVRLAEAMLRSAMPVTAGQLKALTNDGTADPRDPSMTTLDQSLALSLTGSEFEQECRTYTRYLIGADPSPYIVSKYVDFHERMPPAKDGAFDRLLVRAAARRPWMAQLADAYASRFRRDSSLRRKLVLLLGLLESSQPSAAILDSPASAEGVRAWAALAGAGFRYALALTVSVVLLAPLHAVLGSRRSQ